MKQICLIIVGSLIFFAIFFYQILLTFLASWSLHAYSVSQWGKPLQYESLSLIGNQLVIVQPRFEHLSSFKAERLELKFDFDFWKRQLDIEIEIEQPYWDFQTSFSSQWEEWIKFLNQEEKWIKKYPYLRVKKGLLSWNFDDSSQHHQLEFDLEINSKEGGQMKLYLDPPQSNTQFLTLEMLKGIHGMEINCNCERIDCHSLIALAQFFGLKFDSWSIASGFLHGQMKAIFPERQRPYLEGELMIDQLVFDHIESPLRGQIEQARLKLEKNAMAYDLNKQFLTTIGQFDILQSASLVYHSPTQEWSIEQINGSLQINSIETAFIHLQAQGGRFSHPSNWNLQGKVNLNAEHSMNLDLTLSCSALEQTDGKIHLVLNQLQEEFKQAKVQIENLSHSECRFLQSLLATYWPPCNDLIFEKGKFNALIEANVTQEGMGEVSIKQFEASDVCSRIKHWNMTCDFEKIRGYGKVDLRKKDFWKSVNAELYLEEGKIEFGELIPPLPMNHIQAHFLIQQGHVEHSLVTLEIAGLKGKMDVEWGQHKQLLIFKLDGRVQDLAELLPHQLQEGLRKHFYHNRLMILANLKRQNQQIELDGTLHIQRSNTDQMDLIHFGCELTRSGQNSENKYFPIGWFHAQKLPLEKFLSPFIFRHDILQMSGTAEFKGSFDHQFLLIKYDADDLKIENENLCIKIPNLHSSVPGQLVGSHRINLQTYDYEGTFPIQQGSYLEKKSGLFFQDIQGTAILEKGLIRILPIETCCEGVYFAGELELDYQDPAPGVFDVIIRCPTLSGKVSQIQHLLAHLGPPSLLHKIPLEGEVTAKEKGLDLHFAFFPDDYHLKINARGIITEGSLSFKEADMALKGIDMDVDYDHQQQLLAFSDIQGTLLLGKPRRVEEYLFSGHHLHFYQIDQPDLDIDLVVKDKNKELLRLVGHTREEEGWKNLYLNQNLSHFSCIYPNVWNCRFKDWSLEHLEFRSQFDLGDFLQDLGRFRQTGLFVLSHNLIERISQFLSVEGQGFCSLQYHPDQGYTYHLKGLHIKQGNSSEHFGLLKGSKQDKKWIIDQLQWDDWNVYAELHQAEDKWRIPFLGLKAGQTLLIGLEGDWFQEESLLKAKIKFSEIDLSKLDRFESLQPFVTKWWPKGIIKATGNIEWNMIASDPWEGCQASLQAEVSHLTFRDYPLQVLNSFHATLHPHHCFSLENVQLELFPQKNQAYVELKKFEYLPQQESIGSLQASFQIPHAPLEMIGNALHHHFSDLLDSFVKELFVTAKKEGQLKGMLMIDHLPPSSSILQLKLEDGLYIFKNREYDLKQFDLQIIGDGLNFSAFSQHERYPYQIIGQASWPSCQEGLCKLVGTEVAKPLMIKWENHPQRGFLIRSMQGEFSGCSFCLKEDDLSAQEGEWMPLQGQVTINFNRLSPLLTPKLAETIQNLKMGSSYALTGNFWINLNRGNTFLETISFKGDLSSTEPILKGYQMRSLEADMQYVPGRLDIQNLSIQDPAVNIKSANSMVIYDSDHDKWNFFVPRLTVKNLRLGLLRDTETNEPINPKFRSLIVKRIDFRDLNGELDHQQTWQAEGSLHFLNPSRKNLFHPLLAIPAEIILRLGLDPHVLNPMTGIIYFNLQGNRFYLTRFKDVYSQGRGSKFYLAEKTGPSWMDFNGNLSVHVRMKQYNLIFKIAELFTVSIEGNIKKPLYTLQKQSKAIHKEKLYPHN